MEYLGLDLSLTATGLIVINEKEEIIESELISTKSSEEIENRILFISNKVLSIVEKYPGCTIKMEGLSFGSSSSSMLELAALHYYIRISLKLKLLNYEVVPPTVLKKFLTGKGQAKKELMLLYVFKKYGIEFQDNNLCDAYTLSRYGMGK